MTPHIIVQGSSLKYAELPPKRSIHNPDKPTKEYQEAIESAIEVHPESVDFTLGLIVGTNIFKSDFKFQKQGDLITGIEDGVYPIEAKVRIEMLWNTETQDWQEVAFVEPIDKPIWDDLQEAYINSRKNGLNTLSDEQAKLYNKPLQNSAHSFTEGSEIEKIIRDWFIGVPQPGDNDKYVFNYEELIQLMTLASNQVLLKLTP